MKLTRVFVVCIAFCFLAVACVAGTLASLTGTLPEIMKIEDYKPLVVSEVYARGGEKIGEFSREKRILTPYAKIPRRLAEAFIAAEDDTFWQHSGVNYLAIMRAFIVNMTSGEKRQGASTITQQVARSLLLTSEKTYTRKIKEILLAQKMENNLSKEDILYLYLNQIYFGENAYGVAAAADTYFHKTLDKLTLAEMAIMAGLPQAPSAYSPTDHPQKAKARQKYVLTRMLAGKIITEAEMQQASNEPVTVYLTRDSKQMAPYFVETIRQLLIPEVGEKALLDEGLKIYTGLDYAAQIEANEDMQRGLRSVDKRQGYRGPLKNIADPKERDAFLLQSRKSLIGSIAETRVILPSGSFEKDKDLEIYHKRDPSGRIVSNIPPYVHKEQIVDGIVVAIDDQLGLTQVRFAEGQGLIGILDMGWARKPDPSINTSRAPKITKPSAALKIGDVIQVKVTDDKFSSPRLSKDIEVMKRKNGGKWPAHIPLFDENAYLELEQKPIVQGALLSFDQKTQDILSMVGGFEFVRNKNEFNRTVQAKRQTGSAFKTIVYAAAIDKGYTPSTPIQDAPLVYEGEEEGQDEGKTWKPHNSHQKFEGDILFRKALIRSLNIPTIKILEDIGVGYTMDYAHRLGVFSPLNADLSLGLGSSSLTLYEMTKVISHYGRMGQRIRPIIVRKVVDSSGKILVQNLSLDKRFEKEMTPIEAQVEEKKNMTITPANGALAANKDTGATTVANQTPFVFTDPDQLIRPQTAYLVTTMLKAVISEEGGTAGKARALGRPAAGKTGSTNGYFDGWFIGYTPQIATGVWVGFDDERSLGTGEFGADTALPIWVDYMKAAHNNLPEQDFTVPPGVVFANIDTQTGSLASASSSKVVKQAFIEGTEPKNLSGAAPAGDDTDFLKKDLTD
jgi:penicillin-binding protein 1A